MQEKSASRRDDFLVLGAPVIPKPERQEVIPILREGWLNTGPRRFEED